MKLARGGIDAFLTKESDYGIRIVRALADGDKKTVGEICDREHIPMQYAYKILKKLEGAGFLQGHRGRSGGYQLIRDTGTFTIYDIVVAVDSSLLLFECLKKDNVCPNNTPDSYCAVHIEFQRVQELLIEEMRRKTVGEVMADAIEPASQTNS